MPDLLFDRQRAALLELWQLIEERRHGEGELNAIATQAWETAVTEGEKTRQELVGRHERELAEMNGGFRKEQESLTHRKAADEETVQRSFSEKKHRLDKAEKEEKSRLEGELKEALWMADSVLEGGQKRVQDHLDTVKHQTTTAEEQIAALWQAVDPLLDRVEMDRDDIEPEQKSGKPATDSGREPDELVTKADALLYRSKRDRLLTWMSWPVTIGLSVLVAAMAAAPAVWMQPRLFWALGGVGTGIIFGVIYRTILYNMARGRIVTAVRKVVILLTQASELAAARMKQAELWASTQRAELRSKHAAERRTADSKFRPQIEELVRKGRTDRETLEQQYQVTFQARRQQGTQTLEASVRRHEEGRATTKARQEKERADFESAHAERLRSLRQAHFEKGEQLRRRWETGTSRLLSTFTEMQLTGANLFAEGPAPAQSEALVGAISAGLPFGTITIDMPALTGDIPAERLVPLPVHPLYVPAFLPFPRLGGLLLHAAGTGRTVAVQALQSLMLRFLTALPPGKVRFTILDPVGLGDNFAAFMHLADHDEALVTSRIWTEPAHIEKQLTDLTVHMENVIQKYLRSQFSSIEDYNAQAGEVAEPYRVLVVANFPINFTPQAARRLVSIIQSGSSCGVYSLISFDTRQPLPQGFQIEDLEQLSLNLYWHQERFQWGDVEMDRYPLVLDAPPETNQVIETVRRVGASSRDATQVRVRFSFIAPPEEEIWKGDSRHGITVPLGRAGAVRRQSLQLGQGTSQHVLVAGKTGSGKSTLWHALITNLSLIYSPDEVELYLIDFKKGVEFKLYAQHRLPHARVIAIESEREFGRSVLQRLDAELRHRGDLFRDANVHDVAGYCDVRPGVRCPRILLIVDEFQEFFVEDDKVSQEAALLLDRLVRQGRAFGLHVLLGSQTLGGAYSLARSTIDQMAVRIALQCSEADAQLILNKDNSAARLLSRPGEAIYNDTNGSIEGNEVFQVVWLPEEQRVEVLNKVRRRVERDLPEAAQRMPLIFEGNTPAELERNPLLLRLLDQPEAQAPSAIAKAWLGEAIAIKDPTVAVLRPQSGGNLLIAGQHDEAALALLASSLVSLAVQQRSAQFVVFDGLAAHEPFGGYLKSVMEGWPHPMQSVERANVTTALAALADEMNQRLKGTSTDRSVRYVLINGLQRYREFRRNEDDLGFGRRGAERTVSPLEHLQALLRDGPVVGIHLLIWCDTLVNIMRSLDRTGLRECAQRVLFQMSAADSSHLLDSPVASRLGRNRALYFTDEMEQPEKFRPYGLPSLAWLAEVKQRMAQRVESSAIGSSGG
jgi:hypothetical protein